MAGMAASAVARKRGHGTLTSLVTGEEPTGPKWAETLGRKSAEAYKYLDDVAKYHTRVDDPFGVDAILSFAFTGGFGGLARAWLESGTGLGQILLRGPARNLTAKQLLRQTGMSESIATTIVKSGTSGLVGDLAIGAAMHYAEPAIAASGLSPEAQNTLRMTLPFLFAIGTAFTIEYKIDKLLKNPLAVAVLQRHHGDAQAVFTRWQQEGVLDDFQEDDVLKLTEDQLRRVSDKWFRDYAQGDMPSARERRRRGKPRIKDDLGVVEPEVAAAHPALVVKDLEAPAPATAKVEPKPTAAGAPGTFPQWLKTTHGIDVEPADMPTWRRAHPEETKAYLNELNAWIGTQPEPSHRQAFHDGEINIHQYNRAETEYFDKLTGEAPSAKEPLKEVPKELPEWKKLPEPKVTITGPAPGGPAKKRPALKFAKPHENSPKLEAIAKNVVTSPTAQSAGEEIVRVDFVKFDNAYSKDPSTYIGPGGQGEIPGRIGTATDILRSADSVNAPQVSVSKDGIVSFVDGAHRYAAMRDMGMKQIPVSMDTASRANALKAGLLGPDEALKLQDEARGAATIAARQATEKRRARAAKTKNIRQWLALTGGVNPDDASFKGELRDVGYTRTAQGRLVAAPGFPPGFFNKTARSLDELAQDAIEDGWLPKGSDGQALMDAISEGQTYRLKDMEPGGRGFGEEMEGELEDYLRKEGMPEEEIEKLKKGGGLFQGVAGLPGAVEYDEEGKPRIDPLKAALALGLGAAAAKARLTFPSKKGRLPPVKPKKGTGEIPTKKPLKPVGWEKLDSAEPYGGKGGMVEFRETVSRTGKSWVVFNDDGTINRYNITGKLYAGPKIRKETDFGSNWSTKIHDDLLPYIEQARYELTKTLRNPEIKKYSELPDDIFIRFGPLPKSGKSKNYQTGESLVGISAIEGRVSYVQGRPSIEPVDVSDPGTVLSYVHEGKRAMLYAGEIAGYGPDGEPLIKSAREIAPLEIDKKTGNFLLKKSPKPSRPLKEGGRLSTDQPTPEPLEDLNNTQILHMHQAAIGALGGGLGAGIDKKALLERGEISIDPKKALLGFAGGALLFSKSKHRNAIADGIIDWFGKQIVHEGTRRAFGMGRDQKFKGIMKETERAWDTIWDKAAEIGNALKKAAPTEVEQRRLMKIIEGGISPNRKLMAAAKPIKKKFAELREALKDANLLSYSSFDKLTRKQRAELRRIEHGPDPETITDNKELYEYAAKMKADVPGWTESRTPPSRKTMIEAINNRIEMARNQLNDHYHTGSVREYAPIYYRKHEGLSPKARNLIREEIDELKRKSRRGRPEGDPGMEATISSLERMLSGGAPARAELKARKRGMALSYTHQRMDIPVEIQRLLGRIEEAPYPIAKGIAVQQTDLRKMALFDEISKTPDWVIAPKRGAHIPANYQLVQDERFGPLDNMYVRKDIWDDLKEVEDMRGEFIRVWDKGMGLWKFGKVILNPATHARNFMSNVLLAHLGDVNPADVFTYRRAYKQLREKGAHYKEAKEWGLFNNSFANVEVGRLRNAVEDLRGAEDIKATIQSIFSEPSPSVVDTALKPVRAAIKGTKATLDRPLVRKIADKPAQMYEANERLFKMAVFIKARRKGLSVDEAAKKAEKHLFNYADIPPIVKHVKRWVSPFFTFTYKALPLFAEMAIRKPWKVAAIMGSMYGLEKYAEHRLGMGAEEAKEQRRGMPDWMRRKAPPGIGPYAQVRMPFPDKWGNDLFWDVSYILPYGTAAEKWGQSALPFADVLPSGPIYQIGAALLTNTDPFTGREIYLDAIDAWTKIAEKYLDYAWKELAPPLAPGGHGFSKMKAGLLNALREGDPELDWAGRPIELSNAVLSTLFGVKLSPHSQEGFDKYVKGHMNRINSQIGIEKNRLKRDLSRNKIDKAEFNKEIKDLMDLKKKLLEAQN